MNKERRFFFSTWLDKIEKTTTTTTRRVYSTSTTTTTNIERVKGFSKANDVMARLVVVIVVVVVVVVCPRN